MRSSADVRSNYQLDRTESALSSNASLTDRLQSGPTLRYMPWLRERMVRVKAAKRRAQRGSALRRAMRSRTIFARSGGPLGTDLLSASTRPRPHLAARDVDSRASWLGRPCTIRVARPGTTCADGSGCLVQRSSVRVRVAPSKLGSRTPARADQRCECRFCAGMGKRQKRPLQPCAR
jgi:hypothetical protein